MSKAVLLHKYKNHVNKTIKSAKKLGLSEQEISQIIQECNRNSGSILDSSYKSTCSKNNQQKLTAYIIHAKTPSFIKLFLWVILFVLFIYVLLNVNQTTSSIVLRNVQGLTYPALKIVRILSVPVIKLFPALTDFYDESCLVENPFFHVSDMECWPCENIHSVIDLTGITGNTAFKKIGSGTPIVVKTGQPLVTFSTLRSFYHNHSSILRQDSRRFSSTQSGLTSIEQLFTANDDQFLQTGSSNFHVQWRLNKLSSAQIVRQLFPRPYFIPDRAGQTVERFIMIDKGRADGYSLPNVECSYVFMVQAYGERNVVLKPSKECGAKCRTVSVLLKQQYVLWYNWWYWKPISLPTNDISTNYSISYINSYC